MLLFPIIFYKTTANNDIYHQLLATESIIDSFDFSYTNPHPIGIPIISSILILLKVDPILFFNFLSPFILVAIFLMFNRIFNKIEKIQSLLLSFNFCSGLYFLKSFNQFTAEIVSFIFMAILLIFIYNRSNQIRNLQIKYIFILFVLSWMNIFIRDAMVFVVVGCLLYIGIKKFFNNKNIITTAILIVIAILPISTRILGNNQSKGLIYLANNEIFYERFYVVLKNIFKFHSFIPEIIFPKIERFVSYHLLTLFISIFIIIIVVYYLKFLLNDKKLIISNNIRDLILFFSCLGFTYFLGISIASGLFNYEWVNLYRVSGLSVSLFSVVFWLIILSKKRNSLNYKLLLCLFLFLTQMKYLYAIRYETNYREDRLLFDDHREINSIITNDLDAISINKQINVYVGGTWPGRNLYRILKYNQYFYDNNSLTINPIIEHNSNKKTIISKIDYMNAKFEKNKLKVKSIMNGNFLISFPNK